MDRRACQDDARCEWIGGPKAGFCREIPCVATEEPELSCHDGIDNDCDGATDTDDPDCFGQGWSPETDSKKSLHATMAGDGAS
jgi:hypothetical protein